MSRAYGGIKSNKRNQIKNTTHLKALRNSRDGLNKTPNIGVIQSGMGGRKLGLSRNPIVRQHSAKGFR